ncbi:MAG: tetratricopeptide repeat protein [Oscillatoria sp. SIO1A7]|nr:tetratricopeptide repeat protein [Oscillatoria sp. SIO1A7]
MTTLNNLVYLYKSQERYEDAQRMCQQVLEISDRTLGAAHPTTAKIRRQLAAIQYNRTYANYRDAP